MSNPEPDPQLMPAADPSQPFMVDRGSLKPGLAEDELWRRLCQAQHLVLTGRVAEGLHLLDVLSEQLKPCAEERLPAQLRSRLPYLYGLAFMKMNEPLRAQEQLLVALSIADAQTQDAFRVRD